MPADPFPHGSHAPSKDVRHSVVADDVQLGQDELVDVDPDWTSSKKPQPKMEAVIVAGALSTVIIAVLALAGVDIPQTLAVALATLLVSAVGYQRTE